MIPVPAVQARNISIAMENRETIKQRMLQEGYSIINEYSDSPGEIFPDHDHSGDQLLVVLEGSIEVTMNGETKTLYPGDELAFPARTIHSAKIGSQGCVYIDGERPNKE